MTEIVTQGGVVEKAESADTAFKRTQLKQIRYNNELL